MTPRRLLTLGHSYTVALNRRLADELHRAGTGAGGRWEVTVAAPEQFLGSRDLRPVSLLRTPDDLCPLIALPARFTSRPHFFLYGKSLAHLLNCRWLLVHAWEEPFILAGGQIAYRTPPATPLVFATFQNLPKRYPPPFNLIERFSMHRAAGWISFGQTITDCLAHRPGYTDRPMRTIPPGVDTDVFHPNSAAGQATRRQLGFANDGPPIIGYLGRFIPEKGLPMLLGALDALRTPWRALFVGAGPLEADLRAFADKHPNQVKLATNVSHDQVPAYLNAMDLLVAPSQTTPHSREQFGRMLIEAFACGLPVLGSTSGEIPHVLADAGIPLPESDATAWTTALAGLLESPAKRADLSQRSLARAQSTYAWPIIARQYLAFFDELVP